MPIIKEGMTLINAMKTKTENWAALSSLLKTCKPISAPENIDNLYNHFMNGYAYMAMTNYPYESSFLEPMPGNPVNVSCA